MFANLFKQFSEFWGRGGEPLKKPTNPYVTGNPVGGSPAFVGRSDILQSVKEQLRSSQQNAIVLYGQRRVGKTSVLRELAAQLPKENYQTIFFDLMGKTTLPLQTILSQLGDEICATLSMAQPDFKKIDFHVWLASVVNEEKFTHQSLVILFDEFDAIDTPHAEQVRDELFHYLREKLLPVAPQKLKFIFAIGRNISDFQSALVLLRIMTSHRISLLNQQETEKLIRLSEKDDSLRWSRAAVQRIWELTHGHSYLTQLLCSLIFKQLWSEPRTAIPTVSRKIVEEQVATKESLEKIEKIFEKAIAALEWLWDGLPPACKIDAAAFAELGHRVVSYKELVEHLNKSGVGVVVAELEAAPNTLKDWDIIAEDDKHNYQFRVELFRQWVELHKPLKKILQTELGQIRVRAQEYYQQAQTAHQEDRFDEAIEKLRTAIILNPQFIEAYQLLAIVFQEKESFAEAQAILEKFYSCCPDVARSRLTEFLWTRAEAATNRKEKLEWCEKILHYDPNHSSAQKKRKEILVWQAKRFEEDEEYEPAMNAFIKAGELKEVNRIWRKMLWERYGQWLKGGIGFTLAVVPFVYFRPEATIPIPWWLLALGVGIIVGLIVAIIPLGKSPRKRL